MDWICLREKKSPVVLFTTYGTHLRSLISHRFNCGAPSEGNGDMSIMLQICRSQPKLGKASLIKTKQYKR